MKRDDNARYATAPTTVQRLLRAAARTVRAARTTRRPVVSGLDVLKLDIVGALGVTPAAYGLDGYGPRPAHWHRTDLAAYQLRYDGDWSEPARGFAVPIPPASIRPRLADDEDAWLQAA